MDAKLRVALVGAGNRGLLSYGRYIEQHPEAARIVAVAEPREWFRAEAARRHAIPAEHVYQDWRALAARPKLADAVIIATPDALHTEPALAFIEQGCHLLLEKPIAPSEPECRKIAAAALARGVRLVVCHVLRYTPYFRKMKEVIDSGVLGDIATIRHMEQIAFWHYAHSYVRGNWRNEALSSPMLLSKSCHDLDILLYLIGKRCRRVTSFGRRSHFMASRKPAVADARCMQCACSPTCIYSAPRFYGGLLRDGRHDWPLEVVTQDFTEAGLHRALSEGPYGRCVYACDNDVMEHQVVALEFEGGITAVLTVNAFTDEEGRRTEIFGSGGEVRGDSRSIRTVDFLSRRPVEHDLSDASAHGHMGGDEGLMHAFLGAAAGDPACEIASEIEASLESHLMAFAAERSRKTGRVEEIVL